MCVVTEIKSGSRPGGQLCGPGGDDGVRCLRMSVE